MFAVLYSPDSNSRNIREFLLVSTGTNEYILTKDDVGRRLGFSNIPVNFEGEERKKSLSIVSEIVKQGIITGGTKGSSRVQWFKTSSVTLEGENGLEALSTSKIAKAFSHSFRCSWLLHCCKIHSNDS